MNKYIIQLKKSDSQLDPFETVRSLFNYWKRVGQSLRSPVVCYMTVDGYAHGQNLKLCVRYIIVILIYLPIIL